MRPMEGVLLPPESSIDVFTADKRPDLWEKAGLLFRSCRRRWTVASSSPHVTFVYLCDHSVIIGPRLLHEPQQLHGDAVSTHRCKHDLDSRHRTAYECGLQDSSGSLCQSDPERTRGRDGGGKPSTATLSVRPTTGPSALLQKGLPFVCSKQSATPSLLRVGHRNVPTHGTQAAQPRAWRRQ
jgi:hypothetical protein